MKPSKDDVDGQMTFDIPEFDNTSYSVKSDSFAMSVLNAGIKPSYKRCFEGLLSKVTRMDVNDYIVNDKPLRVSLSPSEYNARFPRDANIRNTFRETAKFYQKNSHLEVIDPEDQDGEEKYINIVDTASIKPNGDLEILFTRGVLPHLNDAKSRLLIMDIDQFGKLGGKYAQKLFEVFSGWSKNNKDVIFQTKAEIDWFRKTLRVPSTYNFTNFKNSIFDSGIEEIHEKTDMRVEYSIIKEGRKNKYFNISVSWFDETVAVQNKVDVEEGSSEVVNHFADKGFDDVMFQDLLDRRKQLGQPHDQAGMNAACRTLLRIANEPGTYSLDEILDMTISNGWKNYLPEYYQRKDVNSNSVPGTSAIGEQSSLKQEESLFGDLPEKQPDDPIPEGAKKVPNLLEKIKQSVQENIPSDFSPSFYSDFISPIQEAYISQDEKQIILVMHSLVGVSFLSQPARKIFLKDCAATILGVPDVDVTIIFQAK